jgi:uncharacterized MAPEG superfamily protein
MPVQSRSANSPESHSRADATGPSFINRSFFVPDNANLSPFMQRLARAHLNCIEGLPVFGGLLAIAIMTQRTSITDPLALWLLGARIVQSSIHLASLSVTAVTLRFTAFAVQLIISVYWAWKLLA